MKSIALKKLSLFLAFALLFCSLPVVHVEASSVTDQSKPIFGLTADDVVEKYNQLSDQQKDQVLKSLGNTSIFANSLFGNIFNSTFGALSDAVKKLGDLFFQANGIIYKLGSRALSWVSRLIDKVFDDDLDDLNISQPVIDDFYLNTKDSTYYQQPMFVQPNYPTFINNNAWGYVFPLPTSYSSVYCLNRGSFNRYSDSVFIINNSFYSYGDPVTNSLNGLFVNMDNHTVYLGGCVFNVNNFNQLVVSRSWSGVQYSGFRTFDDSTGLPDRTWFLSDQECYKYNYSKYY